jgi:hypothetical protein
MGKIILKVLSTQRNRTLQYNNKILLFQWSPCWYVGSKSGCLLGLLFCQVKHCVWPLCSVWLQQRISSIWCHLRFFPIDGTVFHIPYFFPRHDAFLYIGPRPFCFIHPEDGNYSIDWNSGTASTHDMAEHWKNNLHTRTFPFSVEGAQCNQFQPSLCLCALNGISITCDFKPISDFY